MVKKVIIKFLLVPESYTKTSNEIENDILKEYREGFLHIPWCYKIEKIMVIDK